MYRTAAFLALLFSVCACVIDQSEAIVPPEAEFPEPPPHKTWTPEECTPGHIIEGLDGSCWRFECIYGSEPFLWPKYEGWPCAYRESTESYNWLSGSCNGAGSCLPSTINDAP